MLGKIIAGAALLGLARATVEADNFCAGYEYACTYGESNNYADLAACVAAFDGADATQQRCFSYHVMAAINEAANNQDAAAALAHCGHAAGQAPCAPGAVSDPTAANFCSQFTTFCPGLAGMANYYADTAACEANYALSDDDEKMCIWYHLGVHIETMADAAMGGTPAWGTDTGDHCQHASATSVCEPGSIYSVEAQNFCAGFNFVCAAGANNQWADTQACEAGFDAAPLDQQRCFSYHIMAAITEGVKASPDAATVTAHCEHASGQAPCATGSVSDPTPTNYCDSFDTFCGSFTGTANYYEDSDQCMYNYLASSDAQKKCIWYHLGVHIETQADAAMGNAPDFTVDTGNHCQHASATSVCEAGPTYSVEAQNFCGGFDFVCAAGAANQWADTVACRAGFDAASADQQRCFSYHIMAAITEGVKASPDAATVTAHCTHASGTAPCATGAVTDPSATNYCDSFTTFCGSFLGTANYYADAAACEANYGLSVADQKKCLWYHLGVHIETQASMAQGAPDFTVDTGSHCQHASASSVCTPGTPAPVGGPATPAPVNAAVGSAQVTAAMILAGAAALAWL